VFRPALPYVLLAVLDYGQMALEAENLGWVAQHEIYFGILLEKWRLHRGRMVFEGWLLNTPFIFVDNAASLTTGREVYGWNKTLVSLRPRQQGWLVDPRKTVRFLTVSVRGYGTRDAGQVRLLEINQRLGQNPSFAPADLAKTDPFRGLSDLASGAWLTAGNLMDLLLHPPLAGFAPRGAYRKDDLKGEAQILREGQRQLRGFLTNPGVGVITLKQFRDARNTHEICYQALVESRLPVTRFNHGGPLGLYNLLQGDITGGFRIHLHDNQAIPIVSSLGLQVARQRKLGKSTVSVLEPFFPFWVNVDLTYNKGVNLAWRTFGSPWYDSRGAEVRGGRPGWSYNTVAGGAEQEWVSPLIIPKATVDVFPLRVHDRRRLARFIHEYLNHHGEPDTFEPWGGHVYMVSSRSRIFSQAQSSAVCEVAFYVPLLWKQNGRLKGVAVAKPYSFVDDPNFAMTLREVQGVPAMDATIVTPEHSWLRQGKRRKGRQEPVLRVKAAVFTLLEAGLESKDRTVIEIMSQGAPALAGDALGPEVLEQLLTMGSKVLSGQANLQVLTLKQFRDAERPHRACYQSLVLEPWTLFQRRPPVPLGAGTRVQIYRYPSLPLAVPLGLIHSRRPPEKLADQVLVDVLTPDHPFRIELDVYMAGSEVLYRTAGTLPWVKARDRDPGVQPSRATAEEIERFREVFLGGPQPVIQALLGSAAAEERGEGAA
jgi:hypothetical protein